MSLNAQEWRRAPVQAARKRTVVMSEQKRGVLDLSQASPASVGIDVAKATFDAALLSDGQLRQRNFAMTVSGFDALHAWKRPVNMERRWR